MAGEEHGLRGKGAEASESVDQVADRGVLAEAAAIDEGDVAGELVLHGVELFEGKKLGNVDDFAGDASVGGGWAPAGGVDVERLVAWLDDVAGGGGFGLPEGGHGEGLGVDVG